MKSENERMDIGMMQDMMQNMMGKMGGMPEMCMKMMQQMMGSGGGTTATPEMQGLFEEWKQSLEEELMSYVKEKGSTTPGDIASKLKISEDTALLLVGKLAREKRLIIGDIRIGK